MSKKTTTKRGRPKKVGQVSKAAAEKERLTQESVEASAIADEPTTAETAPEKKGMVVVTRDGKAVKFKHLVRPTNDYKRPDRLSLIRVDGTAHDPSRPDEQYSYRWLSRPYREQVGLFNGVNADWQPVTYEMLEERGLRVATFGVDKQKKTSVVETGDLFLARIPRSVAEERKEILCYESLQRAEQISDYGLREFSPTQNKQVRHHGITSRDYEN